MGARNIKKRMETESKTEKAVGREEAVAVCVTSVTHTAVTMTLNLTLQNLVSCTLTPEKLVMRKL